MEGGKSRDCWVLDAETQRQVLSGRPKSRLGTVAYLSLPSDPLEWLRISEDAYGK